MAAPAVAPKRGLRQAVAALRHRDFSLFWWGALVSNVGSWMQNVTIPYVLLTTTGDARWVGVAAFLQFSPSVVLGPLSGSFADRFQRRKLILVTQSLMAVLAFALWGMWEAGVRSPWALVTVIALGGVVAGLTIPAWQAFVSELVPRDDLLNAITLNSAQFNGARAVGPAIGGVVLGAFGPSWAFLINGVSYVTVLAALLLIRYRPAERPRAEGRTLTQFAEGIRYMRRHTGMVVAVSTVVVVAFLGNPVFQMAAIFAERVFRVDAALYGLLTGALGGGAVLGAIALGAFGDGVPRSRLVGSALIAYAIALVAFGASPNFALGVVLIAVAGAFFLVVVANLNTSVQLLVPEELRGRVLAVYIMGFTAAYPVGSLVQATLAEHFGARPVTIGAGSLLLAVGIGLNFRRRLLLSLDEHTHRRDSEPVAA